MRRTISLGVVQFSDLFPFVGEERQKYEFNGISYSVKMSSIRYQLFTNERKCCACGIEGTILSLDSPPNTASPHFNLYAVDANGEWVLMTRDHITPRSKGGLDELENLRVMCELCNHVRGNNEKMSLSDLLKRKEQAVQTKESRAFLHAENIRLTEAKKERRARNVLRLEEEKKRAMEKAARRAEANVGR